MVRLLAKDGQWEWALAAAGLQPQAVTSPREENLQGGQWERAQRVLGRVRGVR